MLDKDFKQKAKQFFKDNYLLILSFFFMYIAPLVMLMILACQGKSSGISMRLWGSVVGFLMIIIYLARFKKWVNDKKNFEKHEQLKVPVYLRLIQLFVSMIGFVVVFLVLSTVKEMFDQILVFAICCCVSVFISHLFLIGDSKKRKAHKITRN